MRIQSCPLSRLVGPAMRTGLVTAVAALGVVAVLELADGRARDGASRSAGTAPAQQDGDRVLLTLSGDGGNAPSRVVLRDQEGKELLNFHMHDDGSFDFALNGGTPIMSAGYKTKQGTVGVGIENDRRRHRLTAMADGSSLVEILDLERRVLRRFKISPAGELVGSPPDLPHDH